MIAIKINASRILKEHMFKGEKGTYVDLMLHENRDGPDRFGNDGFVTQSISKEARDRGEKGPILGNWRKLEPRAGARGAAPVKEKAPKVESEDDSDSGVPF